MTNTIITDSFKLTPAVYFKIAVGAILPRLLVFGSVLMLTTLIVGLIIDLRIVLVALTFPFIIFPLIISHIYFSKLLTTEAQFALRPKHIVINIGQEITEIFDSNENETNPLKNRAWKWDTIQSRKVTGKFIVIRFYKNDYTLIIPLNSITDNNHIHLIVEDIV